MTNKIATKIVKQKLIAQKSIKLARGTAETMRQDALKSILPFSFGDTPPRPAISPTEYADRYLPNKQVPELKAGPVTAARNNSSNNLSPSPISAFFGGLGQGVGNQFSAIGNFSKGTIRGGLAGIAAQFVRPFSPDYADDLNRQAYAGGKDMWNALGQYVGVNDAWDPRTGNYRGAQKPNALNTHDQYTDKKYFSGKDTTTDLLRGLWRGATNLANEASAAVPLAAVAPVAATAASNAPVVQSALNAVPQAVKTVASPAITYGAGIPVNTKINAPLFLASNLGQTGALVAGVPGAEYLPANAVDIATRETIGPWAPEVIDQVRGLGGAGLTVNMLNRGLVNPLDEYLGEQKREQLTAEGGENLIPNKNIPSAPPANSGSKSRRPFVDDDGPAQNSQTPINEPDLADPFGDKEQPAPPPATTADKYLPDADDQTKAQLNDAEAQLQARAAEDPTVGEMAANPDGERAKQFRQQEAQPRHLDEASAAYAAEKPPPTNPQDWGGWLQDMMGHVSTSWNNMTPEAQLAFGLGVPLGLVGLLSGNVGGFLLGAVGLGVAGVAASQSGMFGDTAQNATTPAGEKPAEPIKPLNPDEQLSVVRGLTSAADPMAYVAANKAQFDQIANLSDDELSAVAQQFDPQARSSLVGILKQFNDKIDKGLSDLDKNGFKPGPAADFAIRARASLGYGEALPNGISSAELPQLKSKVERMLQILNSSQSSPASNTGAYIQNELMPKIARCWKGYEPVPGKKPYSEDSCRPVGSKKKKKMKKKAENYLSFLTSDKPAILTLIRGYYDKQTGSQSKEVRS
jgi:hypothetical protein